MGPGSGQGLPRSPGGCPPVRRWDVTAPLGRLNLSLLCHSCALIIVFSFPFFFCSPLLPSSSFDVGCRCVCQPRFQMVDWRRGTSSTVRRLETGWERRLDPSFVPRKVLLPEHCQLKSIVSGALWLSAVEAIFWNQGSFLASSPTSRFDSA